MAKYTNLTSLFTAIAEVIRAKKGTTGKIVADNFPEEIAAIDSGGATNNWFPVSFTTSDHDYYVSTEIPGLSGRKLKHICLFNVAGSANQAPHEGESICDAIHSLYAVLNDDGDYACYYLLCGEPSTQMTSNGGLGLQFKDSTNLDIAQLVSDVFTFYGIYTGFVAVE